MKKQFVLFLIFMSALVLIPKNAIAQDVESFEELLFAEIPSVVSAIGRQQQQSEVSLPMYVITKEDIRRSGAKTLSQLFWRVPGVQMRSDSGTFNQVGIRDQANLTTMNLLTLIDGVVVFNALHNGTNWNSMAITLPEIERIEIIRGPGGVLYSSNAAYGVINIITKSALEKREKKNYASVKGGDHQYYEGGLGLGYASEEKDLGIRAAFQHHWRKGWDNMHGVEGIEQEAKLSVGGGRLDGNFKEGKGHYFITARKSDFGGRTLKLFPPPMKDNEGMVLLSGHVSYQVNDFYDISMDASMNKQSHTQILCNDMDLYRLADKFQNNFTYSLWGEHITALGVEFDFRKINGSEDALVNPDDSHKTTSFFFQDEYRPTDKWIFTAGSRAERHSILINNPTNIDDWLWSPRFSGIYKINDNQRLTTSVSRAYLMPSFIDENFLVNGVRVGNIDLEPFKVWNYDFGYHGSFLDNTLFLNTNVFYMDHADMLAILAGLPNENSGEVKTYGFEMGTKYNITAHWSVFGDYSFLNKDYDPQDIFSAATQGSVDGISTHMIGAGTRYTRNRWDYDFYIKYYSGYMGANSIYETPSIKIDGFVKPIVRIAYHFAWAEKYDAVLEFVVNDFLDGRVYESAHRFQREPQVHLGLTVEF
ncbi:MAG: TonB-dependent receptor [Candidatus Omnitrophica bacterium]|nr:TonB-dependent receptor [Candidatus Omnitrophota bacterium]